MIAIVSAARFDFHLFFWVKAIWSRLKTTKYRLELAASASFCCKCQFALFLHRSSALSRAACLLAHRIVSCAAGRESRTGSRCLCNVYIRLIINNIGSWTGRNYTWPTSGAKRTIIKLTRFRERLVSGRCWKSAGRQIVISALQLTVRPTQQIFIDQPNVLIVFKLFRCEFSEWRGNLDTACQNLCKHATYKRRSERIK